MSILALTVKLLNDGLAMTSSIKRQDAGVWKGFAYFRSEKSEGQTRGAGSVMGYQEWAFSGWWY